MIENLSTAELITKLGNIESMLESLTDEEIQQWYDIEGRSYYEKQAKKIQSILIERLKNVR